MGKSLKLILASALCMLVSTACGGNSKKEIAANEQTTTNVKTVMAKDGKAIVVFFSHAGDNYAVGNIEVGNTKIVADYITELTGAEQFEIVTHKYDGMAYTPLINLAKEEAKNGELPEYEGDIDLNKYDTVFIGGPVWWGTYPRGPLGGQGVDGIVKSEALTAIGAKYGKSAAQVALRWLTQRGIVAIPKSSHKERMEQNFDVFDFSLSDDDMAQIAQMNQHDTGTINFGDPQFVKYLIETYG